MGTQAIAYRAATNGRCGLTSFEIWSAAFRSDRVKFSMGVIISGGKPQNSGPGACRGFWGLRIQDGSRELGPILCRTRDGPVRITQKPAFLLVLHVACHGDAECASCYLLAVISQRE